MTIAQYILKSALSVGLLLCSLSSFCQPAIRDGLKLGDIHLHDPWVLADRPSHTYYLYTSAKSLYRNDTPMFTPLHPSGVIAYKSKDFKTWSGPYMVFEVPRNSWGSRLEGVWAPEVHAYKNRYYLFATLNNSNRPISAPPPPPDEIPYPVQGRGSLAQHLRGTQVFVSDSPLGPFKTIVDRPIPPFDYMTLDGTFYVEDGIPYMVYAHEWVQLVDGAMEAIPMEPDLSAAAGKPFFLFEASDAPWLRMRHDTWDVPQGYVTDGPELYRTTKGKLLMLWSSYRDRLYVEALAHSVSGKLRGPWIQDGILVGGDSGHGMLFRMFDGRLMLIMHHPMNGRLSKARLFEMEDTGESVRVRKEVDLK